MYPTAENAYQAQKVPEDQRASFVDMTAKEAKDAGAEAVPPKRIGTSGNWKSCMKLSA